MEATRPGSGTSLCAPRRASAVCVALAVASLVSLVMAAGGCGPRIEYRPRPGFATSQELPDEIVLEDGTVVRYVSRVEFLERKRAREEGREYGQPVEVADGEPAKPVFQAWEELEDGSVKLLAREPEHVVANAMRAFREERYGDLWDQMVDEGVKRKAAEESGGAPAARDRFIAWCRSNRSDAMVLLNRLGFAFSTNSVVMRRLGGNWLQLSLTPQVASKLKLRFVEISAEPTAEGERMRLGGLR